MRGSIEQIQAAISDPRIKVVSFDIFDTLIVRPFWVPTDLFLFLDKEISKLLHTTDVINFSSFRKTYEIEARSQASGEDLTLDYIYKYIESKEVFPSHIIQSLMERELELEMRFCSARKSAAKLVDFARSAKKRVIAVSDMYLPSDFINSILLNNGIDVDQVFVSGELGITKGTGNIYKHVIKTEGVEFCEVLHIGDNKKTDFYVPRKLGMHAFYYPRTIELASGKNIKKAFEQIRSSISNFHAMDELGIRCMLAVAANRVYDDPFRKVSREELFGCFSLGMYCMAQGLWVFKLAKEHNYNQVLFFSRDGYIPFLAYKCLRRYENNPEASYIRTSRKALIPLLLTHESGPLKSGTHLLYYDHSPKSVTRLLKKVLFDDSEKKLKTELGFAWEQPFHSETELVSFVKRLYNEFTDIKKVKAVEKGFKKYFSVYMHGRVLTYDIGYSLRNEILLQEFFPDVIIDACFTHCGDDVPLRRGAQGNINIHTFYSSTPYVSWLPRELFLTEAAPSCIGYTENGDPQEGDNKEIEKLISDLQRKALSFIEDFTGVFKEDCTWIPLQPSNACLLLEAFLHTPNIAERKWIKKVNADNEAASGLRVFNCYSFWRRLRVDYWASSHHFGQYRRYMLMFVLLLATDRQDLKKAIRKRLPNKLRHFL